MCRHRPPAPGCHDEPVLWDVDLAVPEGVLMAIVGPNGAGKTTMIKAMMEATPRVAGTVRVLGKSGKEARRLMVYVPQRASVDWDFPLTVSDVVMQGRFGTLGLLRRPSAADRDRVAAAMDEVNIANLASRQIGELSGGQQQRVFLARALAQEGEIYLMDEPFQGVDAATETAIIAVLRELRTQGKTVLVVHHDLSTVRDYFDDLLLLNVSLVACGPTDEVFTPALLQKAYGGKLAMFDGAAAVFA